MNSSKAHNVCNQEEANCIESCDAHLFEVATLQMLCAVFASTSCHDMLDLGSLAFFGFGGGLAASASASADLVVEDLRMTRIARAVCACLDCMRQVPGVCCL